MLCCASQTSPSGMRCSFINELDGTNGLSFWYLRNIPLLVLLSAEENYFNQGYPPLPGNSLLLMIIPCRGRGYKGLVPFSQLETTVKDHPNSECLIRWWGPLRVLWQMHRPLLQFTFSLCQFLLPFWIMGMREFHSKLPTQKIGNKSFSVKGPLRDGLRSD